MARDFYETTIALPAADGHVVALTGIKASVVPRGASDVAGSLVDIFAADTGVTERPNPIVTTANGAVRFWADGPAEYDIVFEDTITPARIDDRIGWNAVPAKAGSLPTSALVPDAGITQAMLSPAVVNNEVPIGAVLDWWRPSNTVPVPTGFVVCDGRPVASHDFPGVAGQITTPDLRNVFILGADSPDPRPPHLTGTYKGDGAGAGGGDVAADAPGIRGSGGSHKHSLVRTEMPAHNHGGATGNHNHGGNTDWMNQNKTHSHNVPHNWMLGNVQGAVWQAGAGAVAATITIDPANIDHWHVIPNGTAPIAYGGGVTEGSNSATGAHNNMPWFVGLLKIMKVKR